MNNQFMDISIENRDKSSYLKMTWRGKITMTSKGLDMDSKSISDINNINLLRSEGVPFFSRIFATPHRVLVFIDIENYNVSIEKH